MGLVQHIEQGAVYPADQRFASEGFEGCAAISGPKVVGANNHIVLFGSADQLRERCLSPGQSGDLPVSVDERSLQRACHGVHAAPVTLF